MIVKKIAKQLSQFTDYHLRCDRCMNSVSLCHKKMEPHPTVIRRRTNGRYHAGDRLKVKAKPRSLIPILFAYPVPVTGTPAQVLEILFNISFMYRRPQRYTKYKRFTIDDLTDEILYLFSTKIYNHRCLYNESLFIR